ncbi:MAG: hypothetical protein M1838_000085 [Thelocarpon superellum]|nr:MAG: hypothetical protein M1838_000085 [Thelocarpon superellum]
MVYAGASHNASCEVDWLQVLFKRKPVQYLQPPIIEDENADVWVIQPTEEIFADYEAYLHRMDFYNQRRFICEITGHSGLNFFEALKSEMAGSRDVERSFPDALREPVLRKVQFSTISRIDNLVDYVFDEFKQDFYPGENVTVSLDDGERLSGQVREKAKFPELKRLDGTIERRAFARYFVALTNRPDEEALVDDEHIVRDRKSFTKQMLRSFIKNTVTREAWTGAPWLVKDSIAVRLKIDTEVPAHLQYSNKIAEKRAQLAQKKHSNNITSNHHHTPEQDGNILNFFAPQSRLPELKPASKSHKSKQFQQQLARSKQQQYLEYQQALAHHDGDHHAAMAAAPLNEQTQFIHSNFPALTPLIAKGVPKPALPPPIKYPIEDLEIAPSHDGTHRPSLRFLTRRVAREEEEEEEEEEEDEADEPVEMESVGPLLEVWETLNVYCEIFQLDSFTFDDLVEAMLLTAEEEESELLVEIHCAVLKILVDEESKGGKVQVALPDMPEEGESEEEALEGEDEPEPSPSPEPEVKPVGRTTRSSLNKAAALTLAEEAAEQRARSPSAEPKTHQAIEMLADYGWVRRLQRRDFERGGWQIILVGLLYQLSLNPRYAARCEPLLTHLAPVDGEATQETARQQYATLDLGARVRILQIICMLTIETKAIRGYMEECSEQMTGFRKEKIDWQRQRKLYLDRHPGAMLRALDDERKALLPEQPASPATDAPVEEADGDTKMADAEEAEVEEEETEDTDDGEPHTGRSLRRGNDRAAERKRKREEEREKKEKAEAAAKVPKMSPQFKKVLKEIEKKKDKIKVCEEEIATLDNDLREADCPRARCLGRDRFWNRYWWFERNGMPYAGLPTSSTAAAGYANACVWVQGPDDDERAGFIEPGEGESGPHQKAFHMTVLERKRLEEGPTRLTTAHEWGFYDEPDSLEMLIGWLDARGNRENKLRKELQLQRENISAHMRKRREYLNGDDKKSTDEPPARMSTRTRTPFGSSGRRCFAWRNTMALSEIGHLHSEPPRPRKASKKAQMERQTRAGAGGRQGKTLGRQGSRYQF